MKSTTKTIRIDNRAFRVTWKDVSVAGWIQVLTHFSLGNSTVVNMFQAIVHTVFMHMRHIVLLKLVHAQSVSQVRETVNEKDVDCNTNALILLKETV